MKVNVQKLYESVKDSKITLISGSQGLKRTVRWVHITENKEICSFLKGEEIVLITGVALNKNNDLISLVKTVVQSGASGVILNLGPYIQSVDPEIIELCEEKQVPLFTAPWDVYMAEIIQKFCLIITLEDKREVELSAAIKNAILFPKQKELYMTYLHNYYVDINGDYTVMLINIENDHGDNALSNKKILIRQIESISYNLGWESIILELNEDILILFNGKFDEDKIDNCYKEIEENCTIIRLNKDVYCGIGNKYSGIANIYKSYNQAKSVITIKKMGRFIVKSNLYKDLGLYKIALIINDKDEMNSFVNDSIGDILKYDKINNSNLEQVLRTYLKNNGSVKDTAEELFVHRNTVNYKIKKIDKILNVDLSDYESICNIIVALKIHDILCVDM